MDSEEKRLRQIAGAIEQGIEQGIERGRAEGRVEGRAEGRVEGRAEGRAEGIIIGEENKALKIAKEMMVKGLDVSLIAECTKLSAEQIEALA